MIQLWNVVEVNNTAKYINTTDAKQSKSAFHEMRLQKK